MNLAKFFCTPDDSLLSRVTWNSSLWADNEITLYGKVIICFSARSHKRVHNFGRISVSAVLV